MIYMIHDIHQNKSGRCSLCLFSVLKKFKFTTMTNEIYKQKKQHHCFLCEAVICSTIFFPKEQKTALAMIAPTIYFEIKQLLLSLNNLPHPNIDDLREVNSKRRSQQSDSLLLETPK